MGKEILQSKTVREISCSNRNEYNYACKMLQQRFKRNGILEPGYDEAKEELRKKYGIRK